jgi:hypothetical protein
MSWSLSRTLSNDRSAGAELSHKGNRVDYNKLYTYRYTLWATPKLLDSSFAFTSSVCVVSPGYDFFNLSETRELGR